MNIFKPFTTPEYLFRPSQVIHRFRRAWARAPLGEFEVVNLPWGTPIRVRPSEVIGSNIYCYGVFDLVVTESICRLLEPGETAVDIGANIGQMTSLMRRKAGKSGRVVSFEPHPELFAELRFNAHELPAAAEIAPVELHNVALGECAGKAFLDVGPSWDINRGMSRIVVAAGAHQDRLFEVETLPLDDAVGDLANIAVCKMDVEGFELSVLKGATRLLKQRRIRDLIFEDLDPYPSAVHRLLESAGFVLFSLHSRLLGPRLVPAARKMTFKETKDGQNYLATLAPDRARQRFKPIGWETLR